MKEEEGVEKKNDEELEEYEAPKPLIKHTLGTVSLPSLFVEKLKMAF